MTTADAARKLPERLWVVFTDDADGDWAPDLAWEDRNGADNHEANMLRDDDEPPLRTCVAEYVRARTLRDSLGKSVETAEAFSMRLADMCDLVRGGHMWRVQGARALIEQRDAAIRAEGWIPIDYDNDDTLPGRTEFVLFWIRLSETDEGGWARGQYDHKREAWIDVETDGQNDYLEWACGQVTHWRRVEGPTQPPGAEDAD